MKEVYLGDGLYAKFDGYQIELRAARADFNDDKIYLEKEVYSKLSEFAASVWEPIL